jgi:Domain of unknown function (DUF4158)
MASVERTAYPRFRRLVTARELASLSPTEDEVRWASGRARSDEHLLALVLSLTCSRRLGYFPRADEVPLVVVEHVRCCLELPEGTTAFCEARNVKAQRQLVRFGEYATDGLTIAPAAFDPRLNLSVPVVGVVETPIDAPPKGRLAGEIDSLSASRAAGRRALASTPGDRQC